MSNQQIAIPSKPKVVLEEDSKGVYEIDGLYPGYGHTLGNSLRRIILSSLTGAAITELKIEGVDHEFSTIDGVKEDVISIILNVKKVRIKMDSDEILKMNLKIKGPKKVTAGDIVAPSQIEIINKDQFLFEITDKKEIEMELRVETGIGYVPKEVLHKDKVEVGVLPLDAIYTPIRRVQYETENMRVGDRTDYNRLKMSIETDGSISPKDALTKSIEVMITQLKAIVGFKEEVIVEVEMAEEESSEEMEDFLKTRVEDLDLSARTVNALSNANIRTVGGLARKKESDILEIEGLGDKGLKEIHSILAEHKITLKD